MEGLKKNSMISSSHGSCSVNKTSGAKPLGDVQSVVAAQKSWMRDHCKWNLDKNTFKRYELRWKTTLEREWHPDVVAQLNGTLTFDPKDPERFHKAAALAETFVVAHLDEKSAAATHLLEKMAQYRLTGALLPNDGNSMLKFLEKWIIIEDEAEQRRARSALLDLVIAPSFTLVEVETVYWWAENLRARLPPTERTADIRIEKLMVNGLQGELAQTKTSLKSQLNLLESLGRPSVPIE